MKNMLLKIFGVILLFGVPFGFYWYEKIFPIMEFQRIGKIQFPMGVYVESWQEQGFTMLGEFKIEENQIEQFKADNHLEAEAGNGGKTIYVLWKCYNDRHNEIKLEFDPTTLIAKVRIETPDFAGDPVCDLSSSL